MADTEVIERPKSSAKAPDPVLTAVVERKALAEALADIGALVERRNTIPILSNVMIEAMDGAVRLTGTNLDIEIRETIGATMVTDGAVTVGADILGGIVRELPDGAQVSLAMDGRKLIVSAGRARFTLHTLPATDFPLIAPDEMPTRFTLPAATLRQVIQRISHAISGEETRVYLCGVAMQVRKDEGLSFTALDGKILGTVQVPAPKGAKELADVILPRKMMALLGRLIDGIDDDVTIEASAKKLRFSVGDPESAPLVMTGKAVDGTYPEWRRTMPANNKLLLKVDAAALERGVKRVSLVATERTRGITFAADKDRVTVSYSSALHGDAIEEVPAEFTAAALTVGFNSAFLLNTLRAMGAETAHLAFEDARGPVLFTNPDDKASRWIVMPMNT